MYFCGMNDKEWFASWFDTDYYHVLYRHRDQSEAKQFIENLCRHLDLNRGAKVLDLACGKGRHSITLHEQGLDVIGADLSGNSIELAKIHETENLHFLVHDMRDVIQGEQFSTVFNLFTSFGYFDTMEENERVLRSVHSMLDPGGCFVIDFLNATKVIATMESDTKVERDGIEFHISKRFDGTFILKEITFEDKGRTHHYMERVQGISLDSFREIMENNGFDILSTFGDFELGAFDEQNSDRLILIAKKR